MKIYLDSSGRYRDTFRIYRRKVNKILEELGHENINPIKSSKVSDKFCEKFYSKSLDTKKKHYENTMKYLKKADIIMLDLSVPSTSIGYLLDKALENSKPVIVFYHKEKEPHYVLGIKDANLQVYEYDDETDFGQLVKFSIDRAKDYMETRFTMILPSKLVAYLNKIAKEKKTPRAVYIRKLIEKDMRGTTDN